MNKKLILLLAAALFIGGINLDLAAYAVSGPFGYDLSLRRPKPIASRITGDTNKYERYGICRFLSARFRCTCPKICQ